jgi:threonine dehydratase
VSLGAALPVTIDDVLAARERIAPHIRRTPLLPSIDLAAYGGASVSLKAENVQVTGSFKPRGVVNAVLALPRDRLGRGVITMSAGNTAVALAYAARAARAHATVVMPKGAPSSKVEATRSLGGEIVFHADRVTLGERLEAERASRGATLVHPHEDPLVIAGHGTIGLEILEDAADVGLVLVAIGGGGLIAGVAAALADRAPRVRVVGVETRGAPTMRAALDAGAPRRLDRIDTIADGLTAAIAGRAAFDIVRSRVEDVVLVDDDAVREAMRFLATHAKQVVEPAGATAIAPLLGGAVRARQGERVVAILSGGNVDLDRYAALLADK